MNPFLESLPKTVYILCVCEHRFERRLEDIERMCKGEWTVPTCELCPDHSQAAEVHAGIGAGPRGSAGSESAGIVTAPLLFSSIFKISPN